ncbi:hypothetical protein CRD_01534 [Raphidiopsis brookii D9]|nr:hypothetical protein CRD_01534 [Raphidiopsis brookii D9]
MGTTSAVTGTITNDDIQDTTPPLATSLTPTDNATGVAVNANLVMNFNEAIQKGTGNIFIKKVSDNSTVETIAVTNSNVTISGTQLTINPTNDLASGTNYYVQIANTAIRDIAGNNYAGFPNSTTTWRFTTNKAPTDLNLTKNVVEENVNSVTSVGYFGTKDPDIDNTFTYSLVSGTDSNDNNSFTISSNELKTKTKAQFDFETKNSYNIRVRTTDQGGLFYEKQFTINVTDVNEAPTGINLSKTSVLENQNIGTPVGDFDTVDPDTGNTFTYSLVPVQNSDNHNLFSISGNQLKTEAQFDFETKNSYNIRVKTTDKSGLSYEKQFLITVTDVLEPNITLEVSPTPSNVQEDRTTNLVYTFTRTNVNIANALTVNYSIGGTAYYNDNNTQFNDYTQKGAATFTGTTGTITFAANSNKATLTIDPTADTTVEENETVILTLAAGSGYTIGTPSAVMGTITDDEPPLVSLKLSSPNIVRESGGTSLKYEFTRIGSNSDSLTVYFKIGGTLGRELDPNDFSYKTSTNTVLRNRTTRGGPGKYNEGQIEFKEGQKTAFFEITPHLDKENERIEDISLQLEKPRRDQNQYTIQTEDPVKGMVSDTRFYLYSGDMFKELNSSNIGNYLNKNSKTVLFIHGYEPISSNQLNSFENIPIEYRKLHPDTNVILVDWSEDASYSFQVYEEGVYEEAKISTIPIGDELSDFLISLQIDPKKIELIGHSLGSHVAGIAGSTYYNKTGEKLGLIIGLDAAGVKYEKTGPIDRLDSSDAKRVVGIHTDPEGFGDPKRYGHLDVYVNNQKGESIGDHSYVKDIYRSLINGTRHVPVQNSKNLFKDMFDISDLYDTEVQGEGHIIVQEDRDALEINGTNTTGFGSEDYLFGNERDNILTGFQGIDYLYGGPGKDIFVFRFGMAIEVLGNKTIISADSLVTKPDYIYDFTIGEDMFRIHSSPSYSSSDVVKLNRFTRAANTNVNTLEEMVRDVFTDSNGGVAG